MPKPSFIASPPVVALLSWLLPGAGYWAIGAKKRGLTIGITILLLFLAGLLIGGIRVIDPPGYNDLGDRSFVEIRRREKGVDVNRNPVWEYGQFKVRDNAFDPDPRDWQPVPNTRQWSLKSNPLATIGEKPWYVGQILIGPINIICTKLSLGAAAPERSDEQTPRYETSQVARTHARVAVNGTLYTAVAGMLNLLAIIDATHRAGRVGGNLE
jgi:hypothetical protein